MSTNCSSSSIALASKLSNNQLSSNRIPAIMLAMSLLIIGSALIGVAGAEHALSEVWSESEGIQMKYSTDHDDILSTKGSELQLKSSLPTEADGESRQKEEVASTGSGNEEQSNSEDQLSGSGAAAENDSSSGADESSGSEEGADSNKQSNRVPLMSASATKQQPPRYKSELKSTKPINKAIDDEGPVQSYNSALDSVENKDLASVDHGGDDYDSTGSSKNEPNLKFRQPGRHFKEAVKMSSFPKKSDDESGDGSSSDDEENNHSRNSKKESAAPSEDNSQRSRGESSDNDEDDSSENIAPSPSARANKQNMIDFDQVVNTKQRNNQQEQAEQFNSFPTGVNSGMTILDDDEQGAVMRENDGFKRTNAFSGNDYRQPQQQQHLVNDADQFGFQSVNRFHDQSGFRSLAAGSSAHPKERTMPSAGNKHVSEQQQVAPKQTSGPYKQLSYFKGVSDNRSPGQQQHMLRAPDNSPDSIRDNFISPGHFPGSMPHLNLAAASETQKKEVEPQKDATEQTPPSAPVDGSSAAKVEDSTQRAITEVALDKPAEPKPVGEPLMAASETAKAARVEPRVQTVQVTPEPEMFEPESQLQIMAPLLLSTTTMAPQVATESKTDGLTSATNSTITITTSTTAAPSLKRFKFRKYR